MVGQQNDALSDPEHRLATLALAEEVLADVELARLPLGGLVLKASRLARHVGDPEAIEWLHYENMGYARTPIGEKYLTATGRWTNREEGKALFGPATQQESMINLYKAQLTAAQSFSPSGEWGGVHFQNQLTQISNIGVEISRYERIVSTVKALIQQLALKWSSDLKFSQIGFDIFNEYRKTVEDRISELAEDTFKKWPHIFERLRTGGDEAISHALTTCRRILDGVSDKLPLDDSQEFGSDRLDIKPGKTKNRYRAYIDIKCKSQSRAERLRSTMNRLYDRVSTGVHSDVSPDEARAVILTTYVFLGEIANL